MMETTLQGKYLDGLSSRPLPVQVQLYKNYIKILGTDKAVIETWDIGEIKNIDFTGSMTVHMNYGSFPEKNLILEGELAFNTVKILYPQLNRDNIYFHLLKGNRLKIFLYGLISLISVLLIYLFIVAPYIAVKIVGLIPQKQEILLGNKMFESIEQFSDIDRDMSLRLNEFYAETNFKSKYPVDIIYVDESLVNAYAVPGGKIVVYRGLIEKMNDWKQLAGLLAHELAHVEKRHSLKSLSRSLSIYLAVAVLTTDLSGASTVLIDNAFKLNELSHSRSFEKEADDTGFDYMNENKIDPQGMVELFEKIEKEESMLVNEKSRKILRYVSTHPLTEDRILHLKTRIKDNGSKKYSENYKARLIFELIKKSADQK
jgi:beta-barrel assembly-enhancing protease